MYIEKIKEKLINKFGKEPIIDYYYYFWNVVDYCGEERVKESFESVKDLDVIIGLYDEKDNTRKIAKDYNFKIISVEKDNFVFAESKIRNKIIHKSKSNFIVPLNINVEFPEYMDLFIKFWIEINDISKHFLRLRYKYENMDEYYGFSTLFYRPYLLEVRGYDERTSYGACSQSYGSMLLNNVFKLRGIPYYIDMIHKYHNDVKIDSLKKIYPSINHKERRDYSKILVEKLKNDFEENFNKTVKRIHNSYW